MPVRLPEPDEPEDIINDSGMANGINPEDYPDALDVMEGTGSDTAGQQNEAHGDSPEKLTGYGRSLPGYSKRHEDEIEIDQQDMDVPPGGVKGHLPKKDRKKG